MLSILIIELKISLEFQMRVVEMTSEELSSPRTREMFCCLGEVSRGDGSVLLCQGDTAVACAVYGPGEARQRHGDLTERAGVEVVVRPRTGLQTVEDKARESRIQAVCSSAILTVLHPRTYFSIGLQELQDDGCQESVCLNAACLALLDASVPLKFLLASVTVVMTEDRNIICDPTNKQLASSQTVARSTFVFSNRSPAPSIASSYSEGRLSPEQLQSCLSAAHAASQHVFAFYKETLARKFSKEI